MLSGNVMRISTVVTGAVALGGLIWLALPSRSGLTTSGLAVTSASVTSEQEAHVMPPNVVTMLGVPEVIVSDGIVQPAEANEPSAPPERVHAPPVHVAPAVPAPASAPKEAVRRAPPSSNTSLAKILSGQAPPPATRKPATPAPRH